MASSPQRCPADTTGARISIQRDGISLNQTRTRGRPNRRTSNRFPLSLKPKDLDGGARTRQWVLQGSVESGPARSILRRRESLQLSERGRVDQQGGSGPNLAMAPTDMSRAGMDEGPNRHGYKRLQPAKRGVRNLFWKGGVWTKKKHKRP